MASPSPLPPKAAPARRPFFMHLYFQVLAGFVLGASLGFFFPASADYLKPLSDVFIKLVKMLLAPIIFCTIVIGITQMGSLKEVGRVGIKALLYFEVVTTLALVIGLVVVNVFQPGAGLNFPATAPATQLATSAASQPAGDAAASKEISGYAASAREQTVTKFILNIIPNSIADAFVGGNMLQVIFFSVLFGLALGRLPNRGKPLVAVLDIALQGLFQIVHFIMHLAPLAALGAMAYTVATLGVGVLASYARLIGCLYLTSAAFVFIVLGTIAWLCGISLWKFLRYIKDEILITFATVSTETVFPRMVEKLERLGCAKPVVGLVLPAGYTFNADGGCIYMTMAAIFLAQATHTHLTLGDQVLLLLVCLFTSKGSAGVAGAAFIALAATLNSMDKIPVTSLVFLLGVDRFLNEARAVTNVIGNGIATVVVARWEKALDLTKAQAVLNGQDAPL